MKELKYKIPYGRQNITEKDIAAVTEVLRSELVTQGPKIQEFEQSFADYVGALYAVAVSNGTAALHLCALTMNVTQETEVITTPITFAASANCVRYCGGNVSFVDIDRSSYTIDINQIEDLLKQYPNRFSGIIPVDFTGYPIDLESIKSLADRYGLWVIEDACHAPGGYFIDSNGTKQHCGNGNNSDLSIFSFHPVKHIATAEGGMITTNNHQFYKRLLRLRSHGITKDPEQLIENHGGWYYEMLELGYNYRLTDVQSALGISQLSRAEEGLHRRQIIAQKYDKAFSSYGIVKQERDQNRHHAYHLYVIEVPDRKGLYEYLQRNGIYPQVHYIPVHTLPYYRGLGYKLGDFPNAEDYYKDCLSLPMYPTLTDEEQGFVIESVITYLD